MVDSSFGVSQPLSTYFIFREAGKFETTLQVGLAMNQVLPLAAHVQTQSPTGSSSDRDHHPSVGATKTVCSSWMSLTLVLSFQVPEL